MTIRFKHDMTVFASRRTQEESGFSFVISHLNMGTPFGRDALQAVMSGTPFMPGDEDSLREELARVQKVKDFLEADGRKVSYIYIRVFHDINDVSQAVENSRDSALSMIELFRIKRLLLQMWRLRDIIGDEDIPEEFIPEDVSGLLDKLDPRGERKPDFYIYDEFSDTLKDLRAERSALREELGQWQQETADRVLELYGVKLQPSYEAMIAKSDHIMIGHLRASGIMKQVDSDTSSAFFRMEDTERSLELKAMIDRITNKIEAEENAVRERLSEEIYDSRELIFLNCRKIGQFDLALAKAVYARAHGCVKPVILQEQKIVIEAGRNLMVESILRKQERAYKPVSMEFGQGVTYITGTNMGGKTVAVKLTAQTAILAQYGFFVPCRRAEIGLSSCIEMITDDRQSFAHGLSSFGAEMSELARVMSGGAPRTLLMVAEIASGTNPEEGSAITRGVMDFMKDKKAITVITTHYEVGMPGDAAAGIHHMRTAGIDPADAEKLQLDITNAVSQKEVIDAIAARMDHGFIYDAEDSGNVPHEAINIARMMGLNEHIIDAAREWMKNRKSE
ncbi:MAG: hypothetical protein LKJ83_00660 [Eubacteriaceae bacterium]|jgi:dsDNA-specific endonuclease/ATPase MutS2|nr:hypothetical protein [Eubacteriaceae bacterium]